MVDGDRCAISQLLFAVPVTGQAAYVFIPYKLFNEGCDYCHLTKK
jgi:hypothetical protein